MKLKIEGFIGHENMIGLFNGLSIALKCLLLFAVGLGRYRICLFVASYFLIKPIISSNVKNAYIFKVTYLAIGLPFLYFDIERGQIFQIYNNNLIVFFISFALLELFTKNFTNYSVETLTGNNIFSFCQKCGYENIELVSKCKNCQSKGNYNTTYQLNSNTVNNKINDCNESVFTSEPSEKLLNLLKLKNDEFILINIKIPFIRGIHKNNQKKLCKNVVITNYAVYFIDYKFYHRGWVYLERLPFSEIEKVSVGTKHVGISDYPLLNIDTQNEDKFEFFVSSTNLQEEKYAKLANDIICLLNSQAYQPTT